MASLTLKNLPEQLVDRLRKISRLERRSLSQQIVFMLERAAAAAEPPSPAVPGASQLQTREQRLATWRRLAGQWDSTESVEEEIAHIYAARTGGREVSW